jgi:hypothetical protein
LGNSRELDYPLQGSSLDLPLEEVLRFTPKRRMNFILRLLDALSDSIDKNEMALKARIPLDREMRDLRRLVRAPHDKFLYLDERTYKRNVLGKDSPGGTHTYWSRKFMWRMATKRGDLSKLIGSKSPGLIRKLDKLLDGENPSLGLHRRDNLPAVRTVLTFMQMDWGVGCAFPPFHARFFAETYLPRDTDRDLLVLDPCAGWGGRLLGSLSVQRNQKVTYIGVDPERRNREAYEGILRRVKIYLKSEIQGPRDAFFHYRPFEDWIKSKSASRYEEQVDLVVTSPPYFSAEIYNNQNDKQSANRYPTYDIWRERFYRVLVKGVYDLLRDGGVFVLNIADVASARSLERDARCLAKDAGFKSIDFYKLAMPLLPSVRGKTRHVVTIDGKDFKYEPCFVFKK